MTKHILPGQQAPYSQEAEEAVIGAVLTNGKAFLEVAALLKPEHFYILRHAYIWEAFGRLDERGDAIDFISTQEELRTLERLNDIGGPAYLLQLINNTPTSANIRVYAELVHRAATRRLLLAAADEIKALALEENLPIEKVKLEAMQRIDAVAVQNREHYLPGAFSIEHYAETLEQLMERRERGELVGYPLPEKWDALREAQPVVFPGDLVCVSGPSGSGKSAFMETWAEYIASLGVRVDYIHTEMSTDQLLHRRMARHSGVPYHLLATGQIERGVEEDKPTAMARIIAADEKIREWSDSIAYHWMPDAKFSHLAAEMRRAADRGVGAIFLDHFQDVQPDISKGRDDVRALEYMCVWLAAFAEHRGIPVFVASQQNAKGGTKWTTKLIEKAVTLISIRRSRLNAEYGYILDGVEVRAHSGEYSPAADVTVNKARFGKLAKTKMLYHGPGFNWLDMSRVQRPAPQGKVVSIADAQARQQAAAEGE